MSEKSIFEAPEIPMVPFYMNKRVDEMTREELLEKVIPGIMDELKFWKNMAGLSRTIADL
jgi:hypothetical protein